MVCFVALKSAYVILGLRAVGPEEACNSTLYLRPGVNLLRLAGVPRLGWSTTVCIEGFSLTPNGYSLVPAVRAPFPLHDIVTVLNPLKSFLSYNCACLAAATVTPFLLNWLIEGVLFWSTNLHPAIADKPLSSLA